MHVLLNSDQNKLLVTIVQDYMNKCCTDLSSAVQRTDPTADEDVDFLILQIQDNIELIRRLRTATF